jgi:hypothetical protein
MQMKKYTVRAATPLVIAALLLVGACKGNEGRNDSALATDTALNRDLQLANRNDSSQPQLKDVPATPPATSSPSSSTPRTTTSRPSGSSGSTKAPSTGTTRTPSGNVVTKNPSAGSNPASTGGGKVGTIAAGSQLVLASSARVCTNTNKVGDKITATVSEPVTGSNGAVIPAGATVTMTVTQLKRSENSNDKIIMEFQVNSVTFGGHTYALDAAVQEASIDRVRNEPKSKDVQKVATGAVIGAIAGKILGKSTKGAVIGGAAGAAAGAATAAATANYEGCVPQGGRIVVQLNSAAQVRA